MNNSPYCALMEHRVTAGWPSPATEYIEAPLDLNEYLIPHPAATFFVRAQGSSMIGTGIHSGDLLIVDKAIEATDKSIVLAILDGEFTVKQLRRTKNNIFLVPANKNYQPIQITAEMEFQVWGVVTYVIHKPA